MVLRAYQKKLAGYAPVVHHVEVMCSVHLIAFDCMNMHEAMSQHFKDGSYMSTRLLIV